MKYFLALFFAFLLAAGSVSAQKLDQARVPAAVKEAFHKKYTTAAPTGWGFNKTKSTYEAGFMNGKNKYKAHFTASGVWIKTEREVKGADLPPVIVKAFKQSAYASWKVKDIEEHELPGNLLEYRLEVRNGDKKADIRFSPDGRLLSVK